MKLVDLVTIRTGLVLSRKEAPPNKCQYTYHTISLRNITEDGQVLVDEIEPFYASEPLKKDYFTRHNDILLRLSAPYSAVLITDGDAGLLVPAHFAIIRTGNEIDPSFLHWWLTRNKKHFYQRSSGGTMMGTISSGYIAEMTIVLPSIDTQRKASAFIKLANKERQLLSLLEYQRCLLVNATLEKMINEKGDAKS